MSHLTPIKVKIKVAVIQGKKQHDYPNFNSLPSSVRDGMDWSNYFDVHGIGWQYDKCCGFNETDDYNSEADVWLGATAVPEDFALAAAAAFPDAVEIMDDAGMEEFWNTRAHIHEPEDDYDLNTLQIIQAKNALGIALTDSDNDALDPEKPNSGIKKNHNKTWKLYKEKKGISINSSSSSSG